MAGQNLSAGLTGQLEQHQTLSQNLRRSLEVLALPLIELESRITAELAANPLLEAEEFSELPLPDSAPEKAPETEDENDFERDTSADEWYENLPLPTGADDDSKNDYISSDENDFERDTSADEWYENLLLPTGADDDSKNDYISSFAAPPPELRSELLSELHSMPLAEKLLYHASEIIGALNDDGFLETNIADIAMQCDAELDEIETALHLVQQIAPPGIGARDLPECLKLQLQRSGKLTAAAAKVLDNGWEYLLNNRMDMLQKKLSLSGEELKNVLEMLRPLNLAPGRQHTPPSAVIITDLQIVRDENGNYSAVAVRNSARQINISKTYEKLLTDPLLSEDDRAFLNEKMASAKELLKAIAMRKDTLTALGEAIIRNQKGFLDNGTAALKPWTMKSAAAELGVSESTVSRAAADKFAETPQGVLPLKFFFSAGIDADDGSGLSNQAVMEKLRQLIDDEDPAAPLSDEALAKALKSGGIPVARRTVAKYREQLKIPSSSMRKKFF